MGERRRWFTVGVASVAARLSPPAAGLPDPDAMVLQAEDMPGFRLRQTFHQRTGMADRGTPWADRVRERRGRSSRTYFERESADLTSIASMAIPLADCQDAEAAFAIVPERVLTNPDPAVHVLARETVGTAGAPGERATAWRVSGENLAYASLDVEGFVLAWLQSQVIGVLMTGGQVGDWTLLEVVRLAHVQDRRIGDELARFTAAAPGRG
jgi:hypothetical protein